MKKIIWLFAVIMVLASIQIPAFADSEMLGVDGTQDGSGDPIETPPPADPIKVSISLSVPGWTNKEVATVDIMVSEPVSTLQARYGKEKEWTDVTDQRDIKIEYNAIVYIRATAEDGTITSYSEYVECFDRTAPEITAVINGETAVISAPDTQSGLAAVYINGNKYTSFPDDTVFYHIDESETTLLIKAEDKVGNMSRPQTIRTQNSPSSSSNSESAKEKESSKPEASSTASQEKEQGKIGNAKIDIVEPDWTNKNKAYVKVNVSGQNLDKVEAKSSRNGSWESIINTMDIEITDNTDVYVRVTDIKGVTSTVSKRIDCFDNTAPTVNATQEGKTITINAYDEESGIDTIFSNGKPNQAESGTITIPIQEGTKQVIAQAKDKAGNLSPVFVLTVDESLLTTSSKSSGGGSTDATSQAGESYYITIGDQTLTAQEWMEAGVPIYIYPGVNATEMQAMFDENYRAYRELRDRQDGVDEDRGGTLDNTIIEDNQTPLAELPDMELQDEEAAPDTSKKSGAGSTIFVIVLVVVGGAGAFVYVKFFKGGNEFEDDGDMYEADFDEDMESEDEYRNNDYDEETA